MSIDAMQSLLSCSRRTALTTLTVSAAAIAASGLSGCSLWPRATTIPMKTLSQPGPCRPRAAELLVMLPGAYSLPDEFVTEGFVDATRRQGVVADIVIADAHLGYFYDRSVLTRLREDVIAPARAQGYRRIWLVGISLGGFGALAYATRHSAGADGASGVDGVVALAPRTWGSAACCARSPRPAARPRGGRRPNRRPTTTWSSSCGNGSRRRSARARRSTSASVVRTGWSKATACWRRCCRPTASSTCPAATTGLRGGRCGNSGWTAGCCRRRAPRLAPESLDLKNGTIGNHLAD